MCLVTPVPGRIQAFGSSAAFLGSSSAVGQGQRAVAKTLMSLVWLMWVSANGCSWPRFHDWGKDRNLQAVIPALQLSHSFQKMKVENRTHPHTPDRRVPPNTDSALIILLSVFTVNRKEQIIQ